MMTRRLFVAALLWAMLVVSAVHFARFPGSVPDFVKASGGGVLLDVSPSFSTEEIYQRLVNYGEEGRSNYFFRNLTVDILLPLSVLPFLYLLMLHALNLISVGSRGRILLFSLPFVYVLFDLAENGAVVTLLSSFPDRVHSVAMALPFLTSVKRAASVLAIVIPVSIYGFLLVRWWLRRLTQNR
jgi:hypothetical protein